MSEEEKRDYLAATRAFEERGWSVEDVSKGSGIPKFSRLKLTAEDGSKQTCVVKWSTGGRISFTRNGDGEYDVLKDFDLVAHVTPMADDPENVRVTLFERSVVEQAFEENYRELERRGQTHLPQWLNPEAEDGWRFVGSGYGRAAMWSDVVSTADPLSEEHVASAEAPTEDANPSISPSAGSCLEELVQAVMDRGLDITINIRLARR